MTAQVNQSSFFCSFCFRKKEQNSVLFSVDLAIVYDSYQDKER